jgi:hypothetical protein
VPAKANDGKVHLGQAPPGKDVLDTPGELLVLLIANVFGPTGAVLR